MLPLVPSEDELDFESNSPAQRCWLISIAVHVVILLVLALLVMPNISHSSLSVLRLSVGEEERQEVPLAIPIQAISTWEVEAEAPEAGAEIEPSTVLIPVVHAGDLVENTLDVDLVKTLTTPLPAASPDGNAKPRRASDTAMIRRSPEIGDAVSFIGESVEGELLQGDTLVVWMMDASISLQDNRAAMSWYANELYQSIDWQGRASGQAEGHTLMSSVIAYGAGWNEVLAPTTNGDAAIDAMKSIPIDETGRENVMSTISEVVELYRKGRAFPQRMMIVVLTDESGDDTETLEPTIAACNDAGVAVHVIGPTAAMGMQQGWQHKAVKEGSVNFSFWLAVNRGPESAVPERLFLPYWHQSQLPPWEFPGVRGVEDGQWYGGAYRERLLSGFGPYALTRLALQTGGSYTLFDPQWREHGDGAYSMDRLREYFPSYESADDYRACLAKCPLRQFVVDAAEISLSKSHLFAPPRTTFLGRRSPYYPFNIQRVHCPPADFGGRLSVALAAERERLEAAGEEIELLLERLHDPEIEWDVEFQQEPCKRWQAWFQLTKGRLMATRARQLEYLAVIQQAALTISDKSNMVNLLPDTVSRVPETGALITQARSCLQQCIDRHAGTPWGEMAQWELERPFGFRVEQATIAQPSPSIIAGPTKTPTEFNFPSL